MTVARPLRRLFAFVLDGAAYVLVLGLSLLDTTLLFVSGLAYVAAQFYFLTKGQSIGKAMIGMRVVVREGGAPCRTGRMLVREILGKWLSGLLFGLGYIWILIDKNRQGWHDKIVGSVVVQEDR